MVGGKVTPRAVLTDRPNWGKSMGVCCLITGYLERKGGRCVIN